MRTASVAPDGSFTLPLPAGSGEWRVAAYVGVATNRGCIFQCQWRQTQLGPSTTVSAARPPQNLQLSVSARVIGVVVRDRDGNPFPDAGMMVFDQRCPSNCDGTDLAGMFMGAHDDLGDITVVVDPSVTYSFGGYAANQGWPKPYVQNGTEMWFSDSVVVAGSDLDEGTIFRINGGPNG